MKKVIKRSLIIVLCVIIGIQSTILIANAEDYFSAVSDELLSAMEIDRECFESGQFNETGIEYNCILWINDIDMEVAVQYGFEQAEQTHNSPRKGMDYPYEVIYNGEEKDLYIDIPEDEDDVYIQTYIEAKREKAKELYIASNNQFIEKELNDNKNQIQYVSQYTPCIFMNLTITDIYRIDQDNQVLFIDYNDLDDVGIEEIDYSTSDFSDFIEYYKNDISSHFSTLHINTAKSTYGVSGSGVKIGQIEGHRSDLPGLTPRPINSTVGGHATVMHYIMATIAPNASFYGAGYNMSDNYADFYNAIEWLIGKGVNIINMSAAVHSPLENLNGYNGCTRWIEHVAYNHDTHFVKSSGNQRHNGVTEPGMAYNIITVGATNMNDDYPRWTYSSYYNGVVSRSGRKTYKPDLMATGGVSEPEDGGTSISAAEVSGTIALMCDLQPALKTKQHITKAILGATVLKNGRKHVTTDSDFRFYGAGMIDAKSALYAVNSGHYSSVTGTVSNSNTVKTYSMVVTSNDTCMRVSLAYAHRIKFSTSDIHASTTAPYEGGCIGELRLDVYNPNGEPVASCTKGGANFKIVEFDPRTSGGAGIYTIKVTQTISASGGRATNFGVSWR